MKSKLSTFPRSLISKLKISVKVELFISRLQLIFIVKLLHTMENIRTSSLWPCSSSHIELLKTCSFDILIELLLINLKTFHKKVGNIFQIFILTQNLQLYVYFWKKLLKQKFQEFSIPRSQLFTVNFLTVFSQYFVLFPAIIIIMNARMLNKFKFSHHQ